MDTQDKLDKPIGTKDSVRLQPGTFVVKAVTIEPVKKKTTGEHVGDKVVFSIEHPEAESGLVALSACNYRRDMNIKSSALWYNEDGDGNIPKNSALAELMKFYKITSLRQLIGKQITVELDTKGYLCIKAY